MGLAVVKVGDIWVPDLAVGQRFQHPTNHKVQALVWQGAARRGDTVYLTVGRCSLPDGNTCWFFRWINIKDDDRFFGPSTNIFNAPIIIQSWLHRIDLDEVWAAYLTWKLRYE